MEPTAFARTVAKVIVYTPLGGFHWFCNTDLWLRRHFPRLYRRAVSVQSDA